MKVYEVEATINTPEGEDHVPFFQFSLDKVALVIEDEYPAMTSFVLVCVPIKEG